MENKFHTLTITVYDRDLVFQQVNAILNKSADDIRLRTGYPMHDRNIAIIFLIVEMSNDGLGALSGKLGQIKNVKVSTTTLKI
ncbi:MAG: TM1266 family iron-only hydrogenase system putative regulator [Ignavibacteriaceae bacterium]